MADLVRGLRGHGQERLADPLLGQVVEGDDAHVVRHPQARLAQRPDRPEPDEVVGAEDGRRALALRGQHLLDHAVPVGLVELAEVEAAPVDQLVGKGQAGLLEGAAAAGDAVDRGGDVAPAGQHRDPAVAQVDEVLGEGVRAGLGVAADAVHVAGRDTAVQDDDGHAVVGEQPEGFAGAAGRDEEHPVDLALDQHEEVLLLLDLRLVGVAVHHREPMAHGVVLDAARDGGEEGVRDVRDDERDRLGALGPELAGQGVGHVAQLLDRRLHAGARLGAGVPGAVDDPRDGHGGHAGTLRNVVDGAHRSGSRWVGADWAGGSSGAVRGAGSPRAGRPCSGSRAVYW